MQLSWLHWLIPILNVLEQALHHLWFRFRSLKEPSAHMSQLACDFGCYLKQRNPVLEGKNIIVFIIGECFFYLWTYGFISDLDSVYMWFSIWSWQLVYTIRFMGFITGMSDLDPVRWPSSYWRSIKVSWSESCPVITFTEVFNRFYYRLGGMSHQLVIDKDVFLYGRLNHWPLFLCILNLPTGVWRIHGLSQSWVVHS